MSGSALAQPTFEITAPTGTVSGNAVAVFARNTNGDLNPNMDYYFRDFSFGGGGGCFTPVGPGLLCFKTDLQGNFTERKVGTWHTIGCANKTGTITLNVSCGGSGWAQGSRSGVTVYNYTDLKVARPDTNYTDLPTYVAAYATTWFYVDTPSDACWTLYHGDGTSQGPCVGPREVSHKYTNWGVYYPSVVVGGYTRDWEEVRVISVGRPKVYYTNETPNRFGGYGCPAPVAQPEAWVYLGIVIWGYDEAGNLKRWSNYVNPEDPYQWFNAGWDAAHVHLGDDCAGAGWLCKIGLIPYPYTGPTPDSYPPFYATWYEAWHRCRDWRALYDRKYDYHEWAFTPAGGYAPWGGWVSVGPGTRRYWVKGAVSDFPIWSVPYRFPPNEDEPNQLWATRVSALNGNFSSSIQRECFVRYAFSFLHIPYEWGGWCYGGKRTDEFKGGGGGCEQYAVDCSGLVSAAAQLAGYTWAWQKYNCTGLLGVTTLITNHADIRPGDIMNRPKHHVYIIYDVPKRTPRGVPMNLACIEALGHPDSKVKMTWKPSFQRELRFPNGAVRYRPYRLNP